MGTANGWPETLRTVLGTGVGGSWRAYRIANGKKGEGKKKEGGKSASFLAWNSLHFWSGWQQSQDPSPASTAYAQRLLPSQPAGNIQYIVALAHHCVCVCVCDLLLDVQIGHCRNLDVHIF